MFVIKLPKVAHEATDGLNKRCNLLLLFIAMMLAGVHQSHQLINQLLITPFIVMISTKYDNFSMGFFKSQCVLVNWTHCI